MRFYFPTIEILYFEFLLNRFVLRQISEQNLLL